MSAVKRRSGTRVYGNTGGLVQATATQFDTNGTINRNVSLTALSSGGFAMAYEQNDAGDLNIAFATFTSNGSPIIGGSVGRRHYPAGCRYHRDRTGHFHAISQEGDFGGPTNTNALVAVFDLNTLSMVGQSGVNVTPTNDFDTAIAATSPGTFVALTEHTDGTISGQSITLARTHTSDGDGDTITGDDLRDIMFGNGGADTLNGGGGNDTLDGGGDNDTLNGGDGHDTLVGAAGADTMNGDGGNDVFDYFFPTYFESGESINGESGSDTVKIHSASAFNFNSISISDAEVLAVFQGWRGPRQGCSARSLAHRQNRDDRREQLRHDEDHRKSQRGSFRSDLQ